MTSDRLRAERAPADRCPTAKELMDLATAKTGLADFGLPGFLEGLEVLLESLAADVPHAPEDRGRALDLLRRRLVNRLEIEAWFADHPDAQRDPVDARVSICGLPRTGTTALGNTMSLDPQLRALRPWEQETPCPPPRARFGRWHARNHVEARGAHRYAAADHGLSAGAIREEYDFCIRAFGVETGPARTGA